MPVTIYDVARRAGVSASTVSRALNNIPTVDPQLALAVQTAAEELGYRRNAVAMNLRRRKSSLWAVIVSDVTNIFFTAVVRGIEDAAQAASFSIVLCNSDEDPAKEAKYVAIAAAEQVAGVIIVPAAGGRGGLDLLQQRRIPTVAVDRDPGGGVVDAVVVDNVAAARSATEHLLDSGYARIACITGPDSAITANQRLEGYLAALTARGSESSAALIRRADFREAGGYEAMVSLLGESLRPDALFGANNLMTLGALRATSEARLRVPDDIGVVGFDDVPWAEIMRPQLTAVVQPTYDIGRRAAELLVERIEHPEAPAKCVVLHAKLIIRESSIPRSHLQ